MVVMFLHLHNSKEHNQFLTYMEHVFTAQFSNYHT